MTLGTSMAALCLTLCLPAFTLGQAPVGRGSRENQKLLATELASKQWSVRREAVEEMLRIPPQQRSQALVKAVVNEIVRLQGLPAVGADELPDDIMDPDVPWDHYTDLVQIACESNDALVIPAIARTLDMGTPRTRHWRASAKSPCRRYSPPSTTGSGIQRSPGWECACSRRCLTFTMTSALGRGRGCGSWPRSISPECRTPQVLRSALDLAGALKDPALRLLLKIQDTDSQDRRRLRSALPSRGCVRQLAAGGSARALWPWPREDGRFSAHERWS